MNNQCRCPDRKRGVHKISCLKNGSIKVPLSWLLDPQQEEPEPTEKGDTDEETSS